MGLPHWASNLQDSLGKQLRRSPRDDRNLVRWLRAFGQFASLLLNRTVERHVPMDEWKYADVYCARRTSMSSSRSTPTGAAAAAHGSPPVCRMRAWQKCSGGRPRSRPTAPGWASRNPSTSSPSFRTCDRRPRRSVPGARNYGLLRALLARAREEDEGNPWTRSLFVMPFDTTAKWGLGTPEDHPGGEHRGAHCPGACGEDRDPPEHGGPGGR